MPFWAIYAVFFVLPTGALLWLAFRRDAVKGTPGIPATDCGGLLGCTPSPAVPGVPGHPAGFTFHYVDEALHGAFHDGLMNSVQLSAVTAVVAAVAGVALAWAIVSGSGWFKQMVLSASAVLANFGGVPLAFLFIATLDSSGGMLTHWLHSVGINLTFNLYSVQGVELVYLYFMVPLMVLVIAPALEGLRPQWQEAAQSLGAKSWHYWRYVAGPVLFPSFIGSMALLFCSAFSAYATAAALTAGTLVLTPLQIKNELSGNVLAGPDTQHIAAALALLMVLVVIPLTVIYQVMERRTATWLEQ